MGVSTSATVGDRASTTRASVISSTAGRPEIRLLLSSFEPASNALIMKAARPEGRCGRGGDPVFVLDAKGRSVNAVRAVQGCPLYELVAAVDGVVASWTTDVGRSEDEDGRCRTCFASALNCLTRQANLTARGGDGQHHGSTSSTPLSHLRALSRLFTHISSVVVVVVSERLQLVSRADASFFSPPANHTPF